MAECPSRRQSFRVSRPSAGIGNDRPPSCPAPRCGQEPVGHCQVGMMVGPFGEQPHLGKTSVLGVPVRGADPRRGEARFPATSRLAAVEPQAPHENQPRRRRVIRAERVPDLVLGGQPAPRWCRSWIRFSVSRTVRPNRSRVCTTMTSPRGRIPAVPATRAARWWPRTSCPASSSPKRRGDRPSGSRFWECGWWGRTVDCPRSGSADPQRLLHPRRARGTPSHRNPLRTARDHRSRHHRRRRGINSSPVKQGKHDELAGGTRAVQG